MAEELKSGLPWLAEMLRATIFLPSGTPPTLQWANVVGVQPEQILNRSAEGLVQEVGPFGSGALSGTARPGRIDWLYHPVIQAPNPSRPAFPNVGAFETALPAFLSTVDKWFSLVEGLTGPH